MATVAGTLSTKDVIIVGETRKREWRNKLALAAAGTPEKVTETAMTLVGGKLRLTATGQGGTVNMDVPGAAWARRHEPSEKYQRLAAQGR